MSTMPLNKHLTVPTQKGFTLIELMIVSIILSIVIITLITMLQQVNMKSRDAVRLSDMASIYQAIQAKIESSQNDDKLYYLLCTQVASPCQGSSYPVKSMTRKVDGTGWLKIQFSKKELMKYNVLPLDPINNAEYYYSYFSDGKMWKVETKLESEKYKEKMQSDGGTNPNAYELFQVLKTNPRADL